MTFTTRRILPLGTLIRSCDACREESRPSRHGPALDYWSRAHTCPRAGDIEPYVLPEGVEWR